MRIINRLTTALVCTAVLWLPGAAAAQSTKCVTKPKAIAKMLAAKDAYSMATAEATKSDADSALISMLTTNAGPMDAQGRSSEWMLQFMSPAAKKLTVVYFTGTGMKCSRTVMDGPFVGQAIQVTADTIFDTARLIGIAGEAGGSKLDPKTVAINGSLQRSGPDAPGLWTISYVTPQGMPVLQVSIDSLSGTVTSQFPSR